MSFKLKNQQHEKLRNFVQVTNSTDAIALQCLSHAEWNMELAFDIYFQTPSLQESTMSVDYKKIEVLFNKYAHDPEDRKLLGDSSDARIGPNGLLRLLNDVKIDPNSIEALVFAWKLNAETQCEFSALEFRNGLREMRVDSLEKLRVQVQNWNPELNDRTALRSLYQFTFNYAKSASTRHLDIETATAYWMLFFKERDPRVHLWIEFLQQQKQRGISRDTWNLFFDFLASTDPSYTNYDAEGAWPVLIDEFVDFARENTPNI